MNVISSLVILLLSVSHKRSTALASSVTRLRSSRQVSTTRRLDTRAKRLRMRKVSIFNN